MEADLLYPRALAILEDLSKLKEDLTAAGQKVTGTILIGASTIPSVYILPKLAAEFKKIHPGVSFEIRTHDTAQVIQSIVNNEILLGIVGAKNESAKLDFHSFIEDELVLAASTEWSGKRPITTKTLCKQPFILRENGSGTRKSFENFLNLKGLNVDDLSITAVLGSSTAVAEAIKSNLGISILSHYAIRDHIKNGQIQIIDIIDMQMKRYFYTVNLKKRSLPHHYQLFLNYLLSK